MKNCKAREPRIKSYIDGQLPWYERMEMSRHLRSCPDCRRVRDSLLRIGERLQSLRADAPLDAALRARILDGVRYNDATLPVRPKRRYNRFLLACAGGSVAVLAVCLYMVNSRLNPGPDGDAMVFTAPSVASKPASAGVPPRDVNAQSNSVGAAASQNPVPPGSGDSNAVSPRPRQITPFAAPGSAANGPARQPVTGSGATNRMEQQETAIYLSAPKAPSLLAGGSRRAYGGKRSAVSARSPAVISPAAAKRTSALQQPRSRAQTQRSLGAAHRNASNKSRAKQQSQRYRRRPR